MILILFNLIYALSVYKYIIEGNNQPSISLTKFIDGPVLAYVTPWNAKGYEIAENHPEKFDMISPTWLQIKPFGAGFEVSGKHDINLHWIQKIKEKSTSTKIVPRLVMEGFAMEQLQILTNPMHEFHHTLLEMFVKQIANLFVDYPLFDGIVLECQSIPQYLTILISMVGQKVKDLDKILILVIPPISKTHPQMVPFDSSSFKYLKNVVEYFSLMTYDFSHVVGPNSPYEWIEEQLEQLCDGECEQVLMGVPFYGYKYQNNKQDAVLGQEVINIMIKEPRDQIDIKWDEIAKEHSFIVKTSKGPITIYYPTKEFLEYRFRLANDRGVGIAIWEIGQGLDVFYSI